MVRHWQELLIFIFCLIFSGLVSSVLFSFLGGSLVVGKIETNQYIISALTTQIVMFGGAVVLYFTLTKIKVMNYIGIGSLTKKELLMVLLFFGIALVVAFMLSPIANYIESNFPAHPWVVYQNQVTEAQNKVIGDLRGFKTAIAIFIFAILPAIFEELVFRGVLFKILADLTGKKHAAMGLSAFVFSVFHFQVLSFITIFIVGYLLALLYSRTNNLWTNILVHFIFNAIQIVFWQA